MDALWNTKPHLRSLNCAEKGPKVHYLCPISRMMLDGTLVKVAHLSKT